MSPPLMPKATAAWLISNTWLTFEQIAGFADLHPLEVQALADGQLPAIREINPVSGGQLTTEEISRCEADPSARLTLRTGTGPRAKRRTRGPRYTPLIKRAEKPDAIAWLLKHYPELADARIVRLVGTTRRMIESIRERTFWNYPNLQPRSPVELGYCTEEELQTACEKTTRRSGGEEQTADGTLPGGAPADTTDGRGPFAGEPADDPWSLPMSTTGTP